MSKDLIRHIFILKKTHYSHYLLKSSKKLQNLLYIQEKKTITRHSVNEHWSPKETTSQRKLSLQDLGAKISRKKKLQNLH